MWYIPGHSCSSNNKEPACNAGGSTRVWSLGWEDPLEKGMASHSRILAWRIPWIEEPGELQSVGLQRVKHNWTTNTHDIYHPCQLNHNQDIFLFQHQCKIYYASFFFFFGQLSDCQCLKHHLSYSKCLINIFNEYVSRLLNQNIFF